MALSRSELESVSRPFWTKEVLETVYEKSPFWWKLKKNNAITTDGGQDIRFPIRYQKLSQAEAVDPRAQQIYRQRDTRTSGLLPWKYYQDSTMIQWDEQVQNAGMGKIIDLQADKAKEMIADLHDKLQTDLFATTQVTASFSALPTIIDTSDTYADVSPSDATTWAASNEDSTTTTLRLYGSGSLAYSINLATFGNEGPSMIITTRNLKSKAESILQAMQRFPTMNAELANAGFNNVEFEGIPIVGDVSCAASALYGVDMNSLEFRVHEDYNFVADDWEDLKQAGFRNALVKTVYLVCNLLCQQRRTSFKYTALDYTL